MAKKSKRQSDVVARKVALSFSTRSVLLRYVGKAQRYSRRRPAPDVFRRNPDERYLSVNLLGVESSAEIASYYRELFQDGTGRVAICEHKLKQYNSACEGAGIRLTFVAGEGWTFSDTNGGTARAYEPHPLPARQGLRASPSHSGVEYVRVFNELAENAFARRMAKKSFRWHD
jgi:hypothetical protein